MRKTQHGFTLAELMTVLAVVAILVGIATPSFKQFSANSRTTAATNSLVSALAIARSEALRRSERVTVCASSDSQTCTGTNDWSVGWIAFTDATGTSGQFDGTDVLLQAWPKPGGNMSVSGDASIFQYDARGMATPTVQVTFKIWVPGCRGSNQTQIVITASGSPQNTHKSCPP